MKKEGKYIGTDIKTFINQNLFKINKKISQEFLPIQSKIKEGVNFLKSVFTLCNYRENDKCPPWQLQANKMKHDKKKKNNIL